MTDGKAYPYSANHRIYSATIRLIHGTNRGINSRYGT